MFVGKKLVYLQMQKTGSTHVTKVLKENLKGKTRERHEQLEDYEAYKDRPVISSIRNPWDWYVSMWAYGHTKENPLYSHIKQAVSKKELNALYDLSLIHI